MRKKRYKIKGEIFLLKNICKAYCIFGLMKTNTKRQRKIIIKNANLMIANKLISLKNRLLE
jgi:hypothetical protein